MKRLILILSFVLLLLTNRVYCAVTTIDGAITLDFYEDTQFGNNRWILDMNLNDIGGGVESVTFTMDIFNKVMDFDNQYNPNPTEYYYIGTIDNITGGYAYPSIWTYSKNFNPTPVNT